MRKNSSKSAARTLPQRTCVTCRQVKNKREMVRLVRTPAGTIEIDTTGKKEGRGAYLCRNEGCWGKILKGNQLESTFKCKINRGELEGILKNGKDLLKE